MASSVVNLKLKDEGRLAELGYTQELRREWSWLHNFGASYSIIVCGIPNFEGYKDQTLTIGGVMTERGNWYHNPVFLRLEYRWTGRYDHWLDRC